MLTIEIPSLEELPAAAAQVIPLLAERPIAAFYGHMGAGKTTLIAEIAKQLGVSDPVSSPTFAIVNHYSSSEGLPVYHFDFYRLENPGEAFDIGYEEYFDSGDVCLIEWPEKIEDLLPENVLKVRIDTDPSHPDYRKITIE